MTSILGYRMTSDAASEVIWGRNSKNGFFCDFEGRTSLKIFKAKAMESMEVVEAMEAVETSVALVTSIQKI